MPRLTPYAPTPSYPWENASLVGWTSDPWAATGTGVAASVGLLYFARIQVPKTITVSNLLCRVEALGSVLTSGQNLMAAYDSTGTTQLGLTADQTTAWGTTGFKSAAVTPFTVQGGVGAFFWISLLANGTTGPSFQRGPSNDANAGQTAAALRFGRLTTTNNTVMPGSFTPSGLVSTNLYWFGAS